jgi:hypothetical protein
MAMRYIAGRAGGCTDTSRDHGYTDWADLRRYVTAFMDERSERSERSEWSEWSEWSGDSDVFGKFGKYAMSARSEGTMQY